MWVVRGEYDGTRGSGWGATTILAAIRRGGPARTPLERGRPGRDTGPDGGGGPGGRDGVLSPLRRPGPAGPGSLPPRPEGSGGGGGGTGRRVPRPMAPAGPL